MVKSFVPKTVDAQGLKWSPDGRWLAIWETPAMGYRILIYTADGNLFRTFIGDYYADELKGLGIKGIEWSPNGHFLAVAGFEKSISLLSTKTVSLTRCTSPYTYTNIDTVQRRRAPLPSQDCKSYKPEHLSGTSHPFSHLYHLLQPHDTSCRTCYTRLCHSKDWMLHSCVQQRWRHASYKRR